MRRGLLDHEESDKLKAALEGDEGLRTMTYARDDGMGRTAKTCFWTQPGNDITGLIARSDKVAGTMEKVRTDTAKQVIANPLRCSTRYMHVI